jgi:hypothetical protein
MLSECCYSGYGYAEHHYNEGRSDENSFSEKFLKVKKKK